MLKVEIDKVAETARLSKEAESCKSLGQTQRQIGQTRLCGQSPAHLVEKDKAELAELEDKMGKVEGQLAKLKG